MNKITILLGSHFLVWDKTIVVFPIGYQMVIVTTGDENYLCRGFFADPGNYSLEHIDSNAVNGAINLLRKYYGEDIQIDYLHKK